MSALVHVSVAESGESGGFGESGPSPEVQDTHLRVCLDDAADRALREHADVLYFTRAVSAGEVAEQLAAYPGCLVCAGSAADGSVVLVVRGAGPEGICPLLASAVHALLASGLRLHPNPQPGRTS
ncbi:MAG TPA: hypothetical protein VH372_06270 [Actinospica sp.]|jgi:hypothetical protein|nr:hypothetical protein [Actinospica sp.]